MTSSTTSRPEGASSAPPLRAVLAGLGVMGSHHARVLSSMPGISLVGIADPLQVGKSVGTIQVAEHVEEVLELKPDMCVISAPTSLHEILALQSARLRIPTLVEKPLAASLQSSLRLLEAFTSTGTPAAVGHIERFNAAIEYAHKAIQLGEIGEVFQVSTIRQGPFPGRIADSGVVSDLASHDLHLTSWVLNSRYESIVASGLHRSGRQYEDAVVMQGRLENGAVSSHIVNWLSPKKERKVTFLGTLGAIEVDTLTVDVTFYMNGVSNSSWPELELFRGVREGEMRRPALEKVEPLRREHEIFRDFLVTGTGELPVSLREGCETVAVVEAALRSLESHAWSRPDYAAIDALQ